MIDDKMIPTPSQLAALRRIANIPLYGEPINDPSHGDKQELADHGEYDLESDQYLPCVDAESSWLQHAVEIAREAFGIEVRR